MQFDAQDFSAQEALALTALVLFLTFGVTYRLSTGKAVTDLIPHEDTVQVLHEPGAEAKVTTGCGLFKTPRELRPRI